MSPKTVHKCSVCGTRRLAQPKKGKTYRCWQCAWKGVARVRPAILAELASGPGTIPALAAEIGAAQESCRRAIRQLETAGKVRPLTFIKPDSPAGGRPARLYALETHS